MTRKNEQPTAPNPASEIDVPLALIDPDGNVRQKPSADGIVELAASLSRDGLLQAVVVRPSPKHEGHYDIVAGRRRYLAAQRLKWETIRATVRQLDDVAVLRIQLIENVQREDLTPLEEAKGYERLMREGKMTIDQVVEATGKGATYIYQRRQLTKLVKPAQKALRDGVLSVGAALRLARLPTDLQRRAFDEERMDMRPADVDRFAARALLEVRRAPFDPSDAKLLKDRPACPACEECTGLAPVLFPEYSEHGGRCLNAACYDRKVAAHVSQTRAALVEGGHEVVELSTATYRSNQVPAGVRVSGEYVTVKKGEGCPYQVKGLVAHAQYAGDQERLGKVLPICVAKKDCRPHWGRSTPTPREKEARRQERETAVLERAYRESVYDQIVTVLPTPPPVEVLRLLVAAAYDRLHHEAKKRLAQVLGWELVKAQGYAGFDMTATAKPHLAAMDDEPDLYRLLLSVTVSESLDGPSPFRDEDVLLALARETGIDLRATRAEVTRLYREEEKAKAAKKGKRTKKAKEVAA